MKMLPLLLNRITFVLTEYASDGTYRTEMRLWRSGNLIPVERSAAKNSLVAVVVCGHGVVTKPDDAQIAMRVKADAGTFLWSSANSRISFVRRERLQGLQEGLVVDNILPISIFCTDSVADFGALAAVFAEQIYAGLRWRTLLRLTPESSVVAQVLVRRVALPVMGLFLLLLSANALFSPQLNTRRQSLQAQVATLDRTTSDAALSGVRQRELLAEFATRSSNSRATLCDRIAGAVPEQVVLTLLEIEPLTKRFEAGKPLLRRNGMAVICGTASGAADISTFVQQLSELDGCRDVRLLQVEKERETEWLNFRIETAL